MKSYIGDGVYAELENGMIKLSTLEGNVIYLEPEVYQTLQTFADKAFAPPEPVTLDA